MALALNNSWACGICHRQSCSGAVGRPNRLLWLCEDCGISRGLEVLGMSQEFGVFEKRALARVREQLPEGDFVVPDAELIEFLEWLINTFGEEIRKEIDSGKPPF